LKTLHLDTGREMRGGQWQVLRLIRGLNARGGETMLMAREDGELLRRAHTEGLAARPFSVLAFPQLARQFDLVHAHDARAHAAAAVFRRAPLVVSRRVAFPIKTGFFSRRKYGRADRYIAVSQFVASMLVASGVPAAKVDVVYDGVPLLPLAFRRDRVITLAAKGGALVSGFDQSINLEHDLATAAAFVYISDCEGLGSAILLAMSAGVPVIASNIGGIPEIITDGEDGVLVANTPEAIQAAIRLVRENVRQFGARARLKVEQSFTEGRMVDETLKVYRKLLPHD
jgi:glycosyltransferase involved in cell wall biosynthesis